MCVSDNVIPLQRRRLNTDIVEVEGGYRAIFTTIDHPFKKKVVIKTTVRPKEELLSVIPNLGFAINRALSRNLLGVDLGVTVAECILCKVDTELKAFVRASEDEDSVVLEEVIPKF